MRRAVRSGVRIGLWGGVALALAGLLFLVNKLDEMSRVFLGRWLPDVISGQSLGLIIAGQIVLILGVAAYDRVYAPRAGRSGRRALRLFSGGGVALALGHVSFMTGLANFVSPVVMQYVEYFFALVFLGALALWSGLIWFGILTLRRPIVRHWRWLPLCTGLLGLIGFVGFGGEEITLPFLLLRTLFALGLMSLGVVLWLEKPLPHDLASP